MKKSIVLVLLAVAFMALPAFAAVPYVLPAGGGQNTAQYHSYDGLICTDCHTLHNSENNLAVGSTGSTFYGTGPNRELLKRGDWTDMCLSCHKEGQNTSATAALTGVENSGWVAPIVFSTGGSAAGGCKTPTELAAAGKSMPAGDFCYSNNDPKKGHNPAFTKGAVAGTPTSYFMEADPTLGVTVPGGPANLLTSDKEWSCHSCHGMHSRFSGGYTAYRQIKRKVNGVVHTASVVAFGVESSDGDYSAGQQAAGYEPLKSNSRGNISGTNYNAARADTNPLEGADLFAAEGPTNKNVYRGGFSSFCSTCHGTFHSGGATQTDVAGAVSTQGANVRVSNTWVRHPTNLALDATGLATKSNGAVKYGLAAYKQAVTNAQGTNPNPPQYDWKYPLVQPDGDFIVTRTTDSVASTLVAGVRIMCLTCHKAHASQYENMMRWDPNGHAYIANGAADFTGETSSGDNPVYGCGKCHQKGGAKAFVKSF